ncbi:MAG: hypothetical protein WCK01_01145 [Candidatus Uhrbacteria bacterium]
MQAIVNKAKKLQGSANEEAKGHLITAAECLELCEKNNYRPMHSTSAQVDTHIALIYEAAENVTKAARLDTQHNAELTRFASNLTALADATQALMDTVVKTARF